MLQCWRWFGPDDPVSLSHIRQSGATGIVTALHDIPAGEVWPAEGISARKRIIEEAPTNATRLQWTVVESVPVHRGIMTGSSDRDRLVDAYRETLRNVASSGIRVVCYNFMPLLDWSRTDLDFLLPDGSKALRFQWSALAAFDLHILERAGAEDDYDEKTTRKAGDLFRRMDTTQQDTLTETILAGLPGADRSYGLSDFRSALQEFRDIGPDELRGNLIYFQSAIAPVAEEVGIRMAIHPDDPPFPILGLPRVVSTGEDIRELLEATPSSANGLTLCTGSLGARPDNDVADIARTFADRIHFVHLRNIRREDDRSFHESDHLDGEVDMFDVVRVIVGEEKRRGAGRPDHAIPMRPDHGHQMLDDLGKRTFPGYSAIGRLRGLAELRGLELGVRRSMSL